MTKKREQIDKPVIQADKIIGSAIGDGAAVIGNDIFGTSQILPSIYRCPKHGEILADEIEWRPDGQPHCPHCGTLLQKAERAE